MNLKKHFVSLNRGGVLLLAVVSVFGRSSTKTGGSESYSISDLKLAELPKGVEDFADYIEGACNFRLPQFAKVVDRRGSAAKIISWIGLVAGTIVTPTLIAASNANAFGLQALARLPARQTK